MDVPLLKKQALWLRVLVAFVLGIVLAILLNVFVWSGDAKAAPPVVQSSVDELPDWCFEESWHLALPDCTVVGNEINTSPDLRQAVGNTATGCIAGLFFSGPPGCWAGAVGGILGSIPWDGTWD